MTRKEVCGCEYDGPVQVLSCGDHNVAAKNLNKAQVAITSLELDIDLLRAKIEELKEVIHYINHETWKYAKETNEELAVKESLADEPPITFRKMKEVVEKRIGELLFTADKLAEVLQEVYDNGKGPVIIHQLVAAALSAYNETRKKRGDGFDELAHVKQLMRRGFERLGKCADPCHDSLYLCLATDWLCREEQDQ